jgi:hypothetical protein
MNSVDGTKPEYEPLDAGTIKAGEALHGEIICDDDPGRCSILVGGRLLTVEALQRLLNLHEGFDIHLTITDPGDR